MSSSSVEVEIQLGKTAPVLPLHRCQRRPREEVPPWQRGAGASLPATLPTASCPWVAAAATPAPVWPLCGGKQPGTPTSVLLLPPALLAYGLWNWRCVTEGRV